MGSEIISFLLLFFFVILGSINTICDKVRLTEISLNIPFHHIWLLGLLMFISESLCLAIYYILKNIKNGYYLNQDNNNTKQSLPKLLMMLPPLLDLTSCTLIMFGLLFVSGSIYQMFRGSVIIFTFILSLLYLKNRHYFYHYIGISIIIIGLILVGLANYHINQQSHMMLFSFIGIVLIIIGQLFTAIQIIIEEKFIKTYNTHQIEIIGWEGIWGTIYSILLCFMLYYIKCPSNYNISYNPLMNNIVQELCNLDDYGIWRIENVIFGLKQIIYNKDILIFSIISFISIPLFNIIGVTICKNMTGATRAVVDTLRTIFIWAFFLTGIKPNAQEHFSFYQLYGFITIFIGVMVYNNVFNVFDKYITEDNINNINKDYIDDNSTTNDDSQKLLNTN